MRASLGWIVLVQLLLRPAPLSATHSLRGVIEGEEDIDQRRASFSGIDNESAGSAQIEDRIEEPPERRTRSQDAFLAANNISLASNITTIDQYHRDERGFLQPQPRIIGGHAAPIELGLASPHVVLLDRNGNPFCGGTLVSLDTFLTAAHCTHKASGLGPIKVVVGRPKLSDETQGEVLPVRNEYVHPLYDIKAASHKWNYDFALIFASRPTKVRVKIMKLNKDPQVPRGGNTVTVWGHGDTDSRPEIKAMSDTLQRANLRTVSNQQCAAATGRLDQFQISLHGHIKDDMLCAKNRKRDSCQGDSGGALTWRGMQVGITSWGVECNYRHIPGVYARVSAAWQWCKRNICSRSMYPDKQFNCEPW